MVYSALILSKYILDKCIRDSKPITNFQLQRILFLIQKDYLRRSKQAFYDAIEAWKCGPVIPNVYYRFCHYGCMPIAFLLKTEKLINKNILLADEKYINPIVEKKRASNPFDLIAETNKTGGAWERTFSKFEKENSSDDFEFDFLFNYPVISNDWIKKYG